MNPTDSLLVAAAWSQLWQVTILALAVREAYREAERCCDEEVVAGLGCRPADYARCLLGVLELKQRLRAVIAFPGVRPAEVTAKRLEYIMKHATGFHRRTPRWCWVVLAVAAAVVLPGRELVGGGDAAASVQVLAETKDELSVQALADDADQADPVSRGKPLSEWIRTLKDKDYRTRQTAAEAIGELGPKARAAVPALREAMVVKGMVQTPPAKALWQVDRATYTEIVTNEAAPSQERWTAILALSSIGPDAKELTSIVVAIARNRKDSSNREHALLALGFIGADPKEAVPVLLEGLHEEQGPYARMMSAQGLGALGPKAKGALPDLHAALKDPDPQVRVDAAGAIWKIEKRAAALVPILTDALTGVQNGSGAAAQQRAIHYLGQIGAEAKAAFPILLKLWQEATNDYQWGELATALRAIDASAAAKAGVTAKPLPGASAAAGEKQNDEPPEPAWRAAFRRVYGLKEGELLKRVAAPFPASRADYCKFRFPNMDSANISMSYRWDGNNVEFWSLAPNSDGVTLVMLLNALGVPSQEIEVDENWRFKQVPGEFVTRAGAPPEKVLPRLEQILREELNLPVRLTLREVEREVIVVGGKYESKPRANREADQVDLFAVKPNDGGGTPGGSGTFDEFLAETGAYIGRRLVKDLAETPKRTVRWYFHISTRVLTRPDPNRDPEGVLKNITAQTGLTFKTEKRKVRVLFVEKG
jgi:HEAT repeat protein